MTSYIHSSHKGHGVDSCTRLNFFNFKSICSEQQNIVNSLSWLILLILRVLFDSTTSVRDMLQLQIFTELASFYLKTIKHDIQRNLTLNFQRVGTVKFVKTVKAIRFLGVPAENEIFHLFIISKQTSARRFQPLYMYSPSYKKQKSTRLDVTWPMASVSYRLNQVFVQLFSISHLELICILIWLKFDFHQSVLYSEVLVFNLFLPIGELSFLGSCLGRRSISRVSCSLICWSTTKQEIWSGSGAQGSTKGHSRQTL